MIVCRNEYQTWVSIYDNIMTLGALIASSLNGDTITLVKANDNTLFPLSTDFPKVNVNDILDYITDMLLLLQDLLWSGMCLQPCHTSSASSTQSPAQVGCGAGPAAGWTSKRDVGQVLPLNELLWWCTGPNRTLHLGGARSALSRLPTLHCRRNTRLQCHFARWRATFGWRGGIGRNP